MKILVTGVNGQLGYDVAKVLKQRKIPYRGVDIADFDITDLEAVNRYLDAYFPTAVIHCAAYTAVDKAEKDEKRCEAINVDGTRNIANACKRLNAKLMYISTDYVFPGDGDRPYEVDDSVKAACVYGKTKADGEAVVKSLIEASFIVRTSWAFGTHGENFVKKMLDLSKTKGTISVVDDQIGSPTYTADLAELLCNIIVTDQFGIYHATNEGFCSVAEWAETIFKAAGVFTKVNRIPSIQYESTVKRPANSRLSKTSIIKHGFQLLPDWRDAVARYIKEIQIMN